MVNTEAYVILHQILLSYHRKIFLSNRVIGHPNNERIATGYRKRYRGHTAGLGWSPMGFIRPLNPPQTARGPLPPPRRSKRWRYVPSPPFFFGSGVAPGVCRTPTSSTGPSMPSSRPAKNKLLLQRSGLLCFRPAKKRWPVFLLPSSLYQKKSDAREKERSASLSEGK